MYRITTNKAKSIIWDNKNNRVLAKFENGVFETEDKAVADALKKLGFNVEKTGDANTPIEKMSVKELKAYAEEKEIDLGKATTKEDILKVLVDGD